MSGWCYPALYSHSQALWPLLSHMDFHLHLLEGSNPPPPQKQWMVFGLATWLSKQKRGSKTKFPVVLLTQSPGECLFGEKYGINSRLGGTQPVLSRTHGGV